MYIFKVVYFGLHTLSVSKLQSRQGKLFHPQLQEEGNLLNPIGLALHTAAAPEIWIDQSGFNGRQKNILS